MTDLNKAREVAQRLRDLQEGWASDMQIEAANVIESLVAEVERLTVQLDSMQRHESTLEDKDREIERLTAVNATVTHANKAMHEELEKALTKVDVEPVAYEQVALKFATGKKITYEKPVNLESYIELRPLVYASALAALRQEIIAKNAPEIEKVNAYIKQVETERDTLRTQLDEARADAARWSTFRNAGGDLTLRLHNTRPDHRDAAIDAAMKGEE